MNALRKAFRYLGVAALVLTLTLPTLWLTISSFKHRVDLQASPPHWIFPPTLQHYREAFIQRGFLKSIANSAWVAIGSSVLAVVLGYPAAVVLTRVPGPLGRHLLFFILSTRLVPPVALGLPLYTLYRELSLLDTIGGLILAHCAFNLSFAVWMSAAYLNRLPEQIFEAASLDGLGPGRLTWILVPVLAGPLVMVWLFCFIFSWNELFLASVLTFEKTKTLPVAVLGLAASEGTHWGQVCAVASVTLAPVAIFSILLRRTAGALLSLGGVGMERPS